MTKAIYGVAGALALSIAPAWASDAKPEEKQASDTAASQESRIAAKTAATKRVSEGGTGSAAPAGGDVQMNSIDVNAPPAERWLVEREGYRDGGY